MTIKLTIVDVARQARDLFGEETCRLMFPNSPSIDWRLHLELPTGAQVTFARDSTASEVASYLEAEGLGYG